MTIRDANFRESGYIVIAVHFPSGRMLFAPRADLILKEGYDVFLVGGGNSDQDEPNHV